MGYNSSVYLRDYEYVGYLNQIMQNLCEKDVDIIITGSQSGVIPFDTGNLSQFNFAQYNFLLATQPDAVVLCINPFDNLDYIERTKLFVETSVNCKVIAFMVFPMNIRDDLAGMYAKKVPITDKEYLELKNSLFTHFSIPIYKLGDEDSMSKITEDVIEFFS